MKANRFGFTLVELLIVIAIIGILASMILVGVSVASTKAKRAKSQVLVSDLDQALTQYNQDWGAFPEDYVGDNRWGGAEEGNTYKYRNDVIVVHLDGEQNAGPPINPGPSFKYQYHEFSPKELDPTNPLVCVDPFNEPIWYHNFRDDAGSTGKVQPPASPLHPWTNRIFFRRVQIYSKANYAVPGDPWGGAYNEKTVSVGHFGWITNYEAK